MAEAAAYLRVGEATILQAIQHQGLPARQLGADWRFLKSALQDWLRVWPRNNQGLLAHLGAVRDDPYLEEMRDMKEEAEERQKRAVLGVYKALDARVFGVITGLKEGQMMVGRSKWITNRLQANGKKVVQLAMRDITPDRLAQYTHIEAFVQTACPRISIDGFTFGKPVLSIPQADALVGLLEGREMKDFLHRPKWIELTVGQIPRRGVASR